VNEQSNIVILRRQNRKLDLPRKEHSDNLKAFFYIYNVKFLSIQNNIRRYDNILRHIPYRLLALCKLLNPRNGYGDAHCLRIRREIGPDNTPRPHRNII